VVKHQGPIVYIYVYIDIYIYRERERSRIPCLGYIGLGLTILPTRLCCCVPQVVEGKVVKHQGPIGGLLAEAGFSESQVYKY